MGTDECYFLKFSSSSSKNTLSKDLFGYNMGTSTVGRGIDKNKGEYISYYDKWDINPLHGDYIENTLKEKHPILSKLIPSGGEDVFKGIQNKIRKYRTWKCPCCESRLYYNKKNGHVCYKCGYEC